MKKDDNFDRLLDKIIRRRDWLDVAAYWLNEVPEIFPPGAPPDSSLEDVSETMNLESAIDSSSREGYAQDSTPVYVEAPGLRKAVLHESVFLLHKAAHVLSAAEIAAGRGQLTWALSDGYHAALFGARAVLGLFGIGSVELKRGALIFNLWPTWEEQEGRRKRASLPSGVSTTCLFARWPFKIEHRHIWSMFTRLLKTCPVPAWPTRAINKLRQLSGKDFTRQRNFIHYANHAWLNADLHSLLVEESFGLKNLAEKAYPEETDRDFSLALGIFVLRLGRLLLDDLDTGMLDAEKRLFAEKVANGWHPLFARAFPEEANQTPHI
jgi:hypothetical protein